MIRVTMKHQQQEQGAVSLFVVIFVTLLISIVSIGFIKIMLQDQSQAGVVDLSKSAYDSAQAGVEDAKRALLTAEKECNGGAQTRCDQIRAAFASQACDTLVRADIVSTDASDPSEVKVQQTQGDAALNQAYTCVKVNTTTNDVRFSLSPYESKLEPLRGTSSFEQIKLSWFDANNHTAPLNSLSIADFATRSTTPLLPIPNEWPANRPSVIRAQLIVYDPTKSLSDNDRDGSRTLFLYPVSTATGKLSFATAGRGAPSDLSPVGCTADFSSSDYACTATIDLGTTIDLTGKLAYLRVTGIYNPASVKLELATASGSAVNFDGVQAVVDSTGRANDIFRRIESRVELSDTTFPYPEFSTDVKGDICKSFAVTDDEDGFSSLCGSSW